MNAATGMSRIRSTGAALLATLTVSLVLLTGCSTSSSPTAKPTSAEAQQLVAASTALRDAAGYYNEIPASVAANPTLQSNFKLLAQRQPEALANVEKQLAALKALRATGFPTTGLPDAMTPTFVDTAIRLYDQWVAAQTRVVAVYKKCAPLTEPAAYNQCADSNLNVLREHNQATKDLLAGLQTAR